MTEIKLRKGNRVKVIKTNDVGFLYGRMLNGWIVRFEPPLANGRKLQFFKESELELIPTASDPDWEDSWEKSSK